MALIAAASHTNVSVTEVTPVTAHVTPPNITSETHQALQQSTFGVQTVRTSPGVLCECLHKQPDISLQQNSAECNTLPIACALHVSTAGVAVTSAMVPVQACMR